MSLDYTKRRKIIGKQIESIAKLCGIKIHDTSISNFNVKMVKNKVIVTF